MIKKLLQDTSVYTIKIISVVYTEVFLVLIIISECTQRYFLMLIIS